MGSVVEQIRMLVEVGHAEVVLTGVDLTSYGTDLPGAPKLGTLTKQILKHIPDLKRLRISSIDSIEADRDLLDVIASDERLMPHLHLSLQAGDDLILKRMKRRHSRADAIEFCHQARRLRPDIAFGADIIAGFPTETEEMFARSQALVEECDLTFLHVFPYSPRPGTPAARMPQVNGRAIKDRARRLRATGEAALRRRLGSEVGATRQVLIESGTQGRTEHFVPVAIEGCSPGSVRTLKIAGHDDVRLFA
jgi:threonylcarbamoyladenosine tRNA methylthiotransferase MtaB